MAGGQRSALMERSYSSTIHRRSLGHRHLHAIRRGIYVRTHSYREREEQQKYED